MTTPSREMWRRCCDKGCTAISTERRVGDGWYKCSVGFMTWACPEHAAKWRAYRIADDEHRKARSAAYDRDRAAFNAEWDARMEREMPAPAQPEWQASIDYEEPA
jgi:hypothetical protein